MRFAYPRSRSSPWNWSTRLRRWVRMRMPPVRDASTKPSAATVLPAPVACSNQNRLAALGSSGASATSASFSRDGSDQSSGSSSGSSSTSSSGRSSSPGIAAEASRSGSSAPAPLARPAFPLPLSARCDSAKSAVSVPESASTWWAESTVPSTSTGSSWESRRSRPSSSDHRRRHFVEGTSRPSASSESAQSSAARRGVPDASATAGSSPSSRNGSRVNEAARSSSSDDGRDATARVAVSGSAMKARQNDVRGSRVSHHDFELPGRNGEASSGSPARKAPHIQAESGDSHRRSATVCPRCDGYRPSSAASCWSHCWPSGSRRRARAAAERPPSDRSTSPRRSESWRAPRRRWPGCTASPPASSAAGAPRSSAGSRGSRATPWWSTSGRRGAAPAARSSPSSSPRRSSRASAWRSWASTPATRATPRAASCAPRHCRSPPTSTPPRRSPSRSGRRPTTPSPCSSTAAAGSCTSTRAATGGRPTSPPTCAATWPSDPGDPPPPRRAGARRRDRPARRGLLRRAGRDARGRPRRARPRGAPPRRRGRVRRGRRHLPDAGRARRDGEVRAALRPCERARHGGGRRAAARRGARGALGRRAPHRHARADQRAGAVPSRGLPALRRALRRGGHRARRHGEGPVNEVRVDPLTGLKSIIAAGRATRPGAGFAVEAAEPVDPERDPFLEGHEDRTPPEVWAQRPGGGPPDTPGWLVRSVPNLFPAVRLDAEAPPPHPNPDLFTAQPAAGVQEVVVNAPLPVTSLADLTPEHVATAVEGWRERMRAHADAACVHLLVNERREGGASLPHTHAQLYALPFVPAAVARERERFGAYATRTMGGNLLADLLQEEVRMRDRIVAIDDQAVLLAPYASRLPFQLMLVPRRARPRFEEDGSAGAALLHDALLRLRRRLGASPPLNLWVRTAPRGADTFCWRIDILPRLTHLAGLELGTGLNLCVVAPEVAAQELRDP